MNRTGVRHPPKGSWYWSPSERLCGIGYIGKMGEGAYDRCCARLGREYAGIIRKKDGKVKLQSAYGTSK
jgi:hypothetical protein